MLVETIAASRDVLSERTPGAFWPTPGAPRTAPFVYERQRTAPSAAQPSMAVVHLAKASGETTVRKQHTYMTRATANGAGASGPHKWRVPV